MQAADASNHRRRIRAQQNVISALQDLALAKPTLDAPVEALAAWYQRKATVLDQCRADQLAAEAREHANRLRAQASTMARYEVEQVIA